MITAVITIEDREDYVRRLFAAEEQALLNDRASYAIERTEGKALITAKAKDATALRAMLNSICKVLIINDKAARVVHHDKQQR